MPLYYLKSYTPILYWFQKQFNIGGHDLNNNNNNN